MFIFVIVLLRVYPLVSGGDGGGERQPAQRGDDHTAVDKAVTDADPSEPM